jgi:hypothetical protein
MKRFLTFCAAIILSFHGISYAQEAERIELAILLDTSSSMDGLIDQAKANLWKIVNETARAKKGGKTPTLNVALFEYGNDGLPASEGYIRQIVPLTNDLDKVSEELFKLRTNGGSEFCGMVIDKAVNTLAWTKKNNMYKVIYIAGNEPFTQGNVDYKGSVKNAVAHGIIVNTIYCGDYNQGVAEFWKDGAERGDGTYVSINQDAKVVNIQAPQDAEILKLNNDLNKTYIAYGQGGSKYKARQAEQDSNSAGMASEVAVQRSMAKAATSYSNTGWDLVDAQKSDSKKIETLKDEELPAEMQKMNKEERKSYVDKKSKERIAIQEKIQKLSVERQKYVEKEQKKNAGENTLDTAIVKSIRTQATKKGYTFE